MIVSLQEEMASNRAVNIPSSRRGIAVSNRAVIVPTSTVSSNRSADTGAISTGSNSAVAGRANRAALLPTLTDNPSDEVLLAYTFVPFQNREQWLRVAKESVNTPRFLLSTKGELLFGSHAGGFSKIDPEYVLASAGRYSSYELMTLREVLPSLYQRLEAKLPVTEYLVDSEAKRIVRTNDNIAVRQAAVAYFDQQGVSWKSVTRPVKYMKRGYKDITDDFINTGLVKLTDRTTDKTSDRRSNVSINDSDDDGLAFSSDEDEGEDQEQTAYQQERQLAQIRVQTDIKLRVQSRYPLINKVLTAFLSVSEKRNDINSKFFLFIERHYIFMGVSLDFVAGNEDVVVLTKDGINYVWSSHLLHLASDPQGAEEMEFFGIIADLTDFITLYINNQQKLQVANSQQPVATAKAVTSAAITGSGSRRAMAAVNRSVANRPVAATASTTAATTATPRATASLPTRRQAVVSTAAAAATAAIATSPTAPTTVTAVRRPWPPVADNRAGVATTTTSAVAVPRAGFRRPPPRVTRPVTPADTN